MDALGSGLRSLGSLRHTAVILARWFVRTPHLLRARDGQIQSKSFQPTIKPPTLNPPATLNRKFCQAPPSPRTPGRTVAFATGNQPRGGRVQDLRFRDQDLRFRDQDLGFRI